MTGSNPRAGQLSAKLAAERKVSLTSPKQGDERMMVRDPPCLRPVQGRRS